VLGRQDKWRVSFETGRSERQAHPENGLLPGFFLGKHLFSQIKGSRTRYFPGIATNRDLPAEGLPSNFGGLRPSSRVFFQLRCTLMIDAG
jgi:hypothetical protein